MNLGAFKSRGALRATATYKGIVAHALELILSDGDGIDVVSRLVAQSYAATITDVATFALDVRSAFITRPSRRRVDGAQS